jgi:hypothetical protein
MKLRPAGFVTMAAAVALLSAGDCARPSGERQDRADLARLKEIFGVPGEARLVSFDGYPASVGFGQREGLSLSAEFELPPDLVPAFLEERLEAGWRELPIPEEVAGRIPFEGLPVPLEASTGIYTCRTAGDDVLHAGGTVPVEDAAFVNDILVGVFETGTGRLSVAVRSAY